MDGGNKSFEPRIKPRRVGYLKIPSIKINSPKQIAVIFSFMRFFDREKMLCVSFDKNRDIIGYEVVSVGNLNFSVVKPREVLKLPILLDARYIVIIHNHPSGDPAPSGDDMAVTLRVGLAARIFGIKLLYSIVIGADAYAVIWIKDYSRKNLSTFTLRYNNYDCDISGIQKVGRYEIFLKKSDIVLTHSGRVFRRMNIRNYKDVRRYFKSIVGKKPVAVFIYADDNCRAIRYEDIYGCPEKSRDALIADMILKGILLNASQILIGVQKSTNIDWCALRSIKNYSEIVGMPLRDVVFVN